MMWETVAEIVEKNGSQVYLEAEVEGILWDKTGVQSLEVSINGQKKAFPWNHLHQQYANTRTYTEA